MGKKNSPQKHHNSTPIVAIVAIIAVVGLVFLYSSMDKTAVAPGQEETLQAIDDESAAEPTGEAGRYAMPRRNVLITTPPTAVKTMAAGTPPPVATGTRCLDDTDPETQPSLRGMVTLPPPQGLDLPEYLRDSCASGTMLEQVDCVRGSVRYVPADCSTMKCGNKPCNYCNQGTCGYFE